MIKSLASALEAARAHAAAEEQPAVRDLAKHVRQVREALPHRSEDQCFWALVECDIDVERLSQLSARKSTHFNLRAAV